MSAIRKCLRVVCASAAVLVFGACTVGPNYVAPVTEVPESFARLENETLAATEPELEWWRGLGDPVLDELVERAREANLDLRVAEAHLRASRALLGLERRELWPTGSATAAIEESESSGTNLPPGIDRSNTYYSAALDASWELDLFGGIRRGIEASAARYEASLAERRAVVVAVVGELAGTYVGLRSVQRRLEVARANVKNQEESLGMVETLLEAGRGTDLDRARAEAQLETTRASLPRLELEEARAIHRLAVLVGEPPTRLLPLLEPHGELPPMPERIAVGDPAELLRRRPDVASAERRLAAATAEIGVEVADLFPSVSLTGSFGYLATSLDDLGSRRARTTSFGPFLSWAVFDLGRVRERIHAAEAGAEAALATYEKTVLLALEETENALVRLDRAREAQARWMRAERAASEAAELARVRYRHGLDSFLAVLDAEARLLQAQDSLAESAGETALAVVVLYEALGGGWTERSEVAVAHVQSEEAPS